MYFCPNCHFSFDIGKSTNSIVNEKNVIKKVADVFKKIESNEDLSLFKTDIKIDEIMKNSKYKKLSDENKQKINILYEEEPTSSGIKFKCNNCNYEKEIKESILLYEYNVNAKLEKVRSKEENKFITSNPILPRTHDYNCKNESCETHKNPSKKEAVFMRENGSMKVNYICTVCYYNW